MSPSGVDQTDSSCHGLMITWLARLPGVRLRLDECCAPAVHAMVGRMERLCADVELYSLDAGLGAAVVACLTLGDGVEWPGAVVGCGAGRCMAAAVRRAVLETASLGPLLHTGYQAPLEPGLRVTELW
jgi:ribosomal protein S12 methylthiotransferase accessory factor YcaO